MPATYEPIASQTLGSAAASVTFSSIPGTYTDLRLVAVPIHTSASAAQAAIRLNADANSNYSLTYLDGDGASAISGRLSSQTRVAIYYSAIASSSPITSVNDFLSYSSTAINKTWLTAAATPGYLSRYVSLWRSTSAINQIEITSVVGSNFQAGSTFSLYGIKAA